MSATSMSREKGDPWISKRHSETESKGLEKKNSEETGEKPPCSSHEHKMEVLEVLRISTQETSTGNIKTKSLTEVHVQWIYTVGWYAYSDTQSNEDSWSKGIRGQRIGKQWKLVCMARLKFQKWKWCHEKKRNKNGRKVHFATHMDVRNLKNQIWTTCCWNKGTCRTQRQCSTRRHRSSRLRYRVRPLCVTHDGRKGLGHHLKTPSMCWTSQSCCQCVHTCTHGRRTGIVSTSKRCVSCDLDTATTFHTTDKFGSNRRPSRSIGRTVVGQTQADYYWNENWEIVTGLETLYITLWHTVYNGITDDRQLVSDVCAHSRELAFGNGDGIWSDDWRSSSDVSLRASRASLCALLVGLVIRMVFWLSVASVRVDSETRLSLTVWRKLTGL